MAAAEDGDAALAAVLQHRQFLGQGVNPVEGRQIKRPGQRTPPADSSKLAVVKR
jgi:hypothetical protein